MVTFRPFPGAACRTRDPLHLGGPGRDSSGQDPTTFEINGTQASKWSCVSYYLDFCKHSVVLRRAAAINSCAVGSVAESSSNRHAWCVIEGSGKGMGIVASELEELISTYCAAWEEPDAARRRELLVKVWAEDGIYIDPTVETNGIDELVAHIGVVQRTYPGSRIERTSFIDRHHHVLRFKWCMVLADGKRLPEGLDVGQLSQDGKLQRITGFFGAPKLRGQI
jgi:hypothetical protein